MTILHAILSHPDDAIAVAGFLAGLIGVNRWRAAHAATASQIDRWTQIAAAGVVLAIRAGLFGAHDDAAAAFVGRLRQLARVSGFALTPDQELRAVAEAHGALVRAGADKLDLELAKLGAAAQAMLDHLAALPKV